MKKILLSLIILFCTLLSFHYGFAQAATYPSQNNTQQTNPQQQNQQYVVPPPPPSVKSTGPLPGAGKEISIIGGYSFGDKFEVDYGTARIDESGWIDATLSIPIKQIVNLELTYQYQPATLSIYSYNIDQPYVDANVNYFLIGAVKTLRSPYPVVPFGGLKFGAAMASFADYSDAWLFAVQLEGGLKYFISDRVGIKLQIQLNMPMQGVGASIGCGTGGCGYGVSTFTTITQFGGGGGLVFAF